MEKYFENVMKNNFKEIKLDYKKTFFFIEEKNKEFTNLNVFFDKYIYKTHKLKKKFFIAENRLEISTRFLLYYKPKLFNIKNMIQITGRKNEDNVIKYLNIINVLYSEININNKVNQSKLINIVLNETTKKGDLNNIFQYILEKLVKRGNLIVNIISVIDRKIINFLISLTSFFKKMLIIKKTFDNHYLIIFKKFIYNKENTKNNRVIKKLINFKEFDYNFNLKKDEEELFKYAVKYAKTLSLTINNESKKDTWMIKPIFFPVIFKGKLINYNKFKTTDEGIFSVTPPVEANLFSLIIKNMFPKAKIIMDGTANCGGNTISFGLFFDKVISIEFEKENFDALKNNVSLYDLDNVEIRHGNTLNYYKKEKYDILFLDPPWGGPNYKKKSILDLKLGNKDIKDIIHDLNNLKVMGLVFKLPNNFNITQNYLIGRYLSIIKIRNYYCALIKF
jgi:precorrin-6B methylase 2